MSPPVASLPFCPMTRGSRFRFPLPILCHGLPGAPRLARLRPPVRNLLVDRGLARHHRAGLTREQETGSDRLGSLGNLFVTIRFEPSPHSTGAEDRGNVS